MRQLFGNQRGMLRPSQNWPTAHANLLLALFSISNQDAAVGIEPKAHIAASEGDGKTLGSRIADLEVNRRAPPKCGCGEWPDRCLAS